MYFTLSIFWGCNNKNSANGIHASGTFEVTEVMIRSKVTGDATKLFVREGDTIQKGEILARIDTSDYVIELRQAEAGLALAEAQLNLVKQGAREEDIAAALEQVNQAKADFEKVSADLKRYESLFSSGSVTQSQLEEIQTRNASAEARYRASVQLLTKLEKGPRREEIEVAEAQVAQAQTIVDRIRKKIDDCTIVSPINGTILEQLIEEGELTSPGSSLFVIGELSRVTLTIYVKETDLGKVKYGQDAGVFIDSYPDSEFVGTVSFISDRAEFTPKNIQTKEERVKFVYKVEISLQNPEGIFKAGMPADAVLR
ncbi:hypothetical protein AMJ80_00530 [bacterium SM23_31]|nr:MAG: hypothetical protein AMJ80_00530 [bacterium SM23_31]